MSAQLTPQGGITPGTPGSGVHGAHTAAEGMLTVTVRVENTYEDGHESATVVEVPAPTSLDEETIEDWWETEVFPHTGDGHGADNPKLGSWYEATITRADEPTLVGKTMEWG
jgi:hypothetical protein